MAMLTCVSWYSIAVHVECDVLKWILTGGITVVLRMVYSEVKLVPVAFRLLYHVKPTKKKV